MTKTQIQNRLSAYFFGAGYPLTVGLLCFLSHVSSLEWLFGGVIVISASFALILTDSMRAILCPVACICYHIARVDGAQSKDSPDYYLSGIGAVVFSVLVLSFCLSAAIFFVKKYRRGALAGAKTPFSLSAPLLTLALLLNGIGAEGYTPKNLLMGIFSSLTLFFFFYLFYFGLIGEKTEKIIDSFTLSGAVIALTVSAELLWLYTSGGVISDGAVIKERMVFGWGIWNTAGSILVSAIPACFLGFFCGRHRWFYFASASIGYIAAVMTLSRNALVLSTVIYISLFIVSAFIGNSRRVMKKLLPIFALFCAVLAAILSPKIVKLLSDYIDRGFSDNGRFALWRAGISDFLSAPIFGRGFFGVSAPPDFASALPGMLHSTPIQLLASSGVFGFLSYLIYRAESLLRIFLRPSREVIIVSLSFISVLFGSLIDNFIFYMHQMIFPSIALAIAFIMTVPNANFKKFQKGIDN